MLQKLPGSIPFLVLILFLLIIQNGQAQSINSIMNNKISDSKTELYNPDNIKSTIFTEDFTGQSLPQGWTNVSNIGGTRVWQFNNPSGRNITGPMDSDFAILDSYNYGAVSENASLTTKAIDVTGLSSVYLGFVQYFRAGYNSYGLIEVSNDNVNWTLVDSITTNIGYPGDAVYTEYDITEVAAGQSSVYSRWTYVGTNALWWAIDNVVVYEPDLYPNPAINVSPSDGATNISVTSSLNWINDGGSLPIGYRLYFGTDGGGVTPPTEVENNTDLGLETTYIPSDNLSFNTTYYWMIVPYSAEGDATGNVVWSFTTAEDLQSGFSIEPDMLDFGNVETGDNSTLDAIISNTGNVDLVISNIISTDDQFSFSPVIFPLTLTPGNNQTLDVTFTPVNSGNQSASLEITHNADNSPSTLLLRGTGVDAGPGFTVDPASLNFGNVDPGSSSQLTVIVSNPGMVNQLIISDASIEGAEFTVEPTSATINAGENKEFTITFTPPAEGQFDDDLIFTDNAPGSPHSVGLSGSGAVPPPSTGLSFEHIRLNLLEDESYTENINLISLPADAHAIQFELILNTEANDNTILTFEKIEKGSDVDDANWILDYSVFRGPITANGASVDTVFVLLYNLNQTSVLTAGDYDNLLSVNYRVADLPALQDSLKSSIRIIDAEASTFNGNPVDIAPSVDDLTILAKNRASSLGDVNGDGCLDILDLILVVDHIVHKDSLTGDAFTRADIAPWPEGTQTSSPDGIINVQDLSLIQYIILSKIYPDGTPLNGCNYTAMQKINGNEDAIVTLYINKEGISVYIESKFDIRGAQIEFGNLNNDPGNLVINTALGQGYYMKGNNTLRAVYYDRLGIKYIESGKNFMADMPFRINNPEEITIDNVILVDNNKYELQDISVEIVYSDAPSLPLDYILFQNYPNPFNPATTVKFQVPKSGNVTVEIYNMLGQEVRTLFTGQIQRGTYSVKWDGLNDSGIKMSSGTYIYRMRATPAGGQSGDFVQSKKMLLLK